MESSLTSGGVGHFGTWLRPWITWQNVPVDRGELVTVFCSIRFRWSPWLFSLINMLSSLTRIVNRFWWMNKASLLINSLPARSTLYCDLSFRKISALRNQNHSMYFISFNYFETPEVVLISQSTVSGDSNNAASYRKLGPHIRLY